MKFLYIKVKIEKITCEKIKVNQTSIANRLNHSSSNVLRFGYLQLERFGKYLFQTINPF